MDNYSRARKRVKKKKGFYNHFGIYVIMSIFFLILNMAEADEIWFIYPVASWGIAIAIHYLSVFGFPFTKVLSDEWEDREMEKEMDRLEGHQSFIPEDELDEEDDRLDLGELQRQKEKKKEKLKNYDDRDFV